MRKNLIVAAFAGIMASSAAIAQQSNPPQPRMERPREIPNPYAAYDFLIGDWYSRPGGGQDILIHQSFRWGPNKSYITYSTYNSERGQPEQLHFEGIMVWNGKTNALDYVFAVEPGSGAQEKGTVRAEADGSVVREVEFTGAKGQVAHFRQKFWRDAGTVMTSLMRQTASGWELNFPGSDRIAMERR